MNLDFTQELKMLQDFHKMTESEKVLLPDLKMGSKTLKMPMCSFGDLKIDTN